jgi:hypothetical protein
MDASITSFQVSVADTALESLKTKLSHTTLPDDVPMSNSWDFGPPLSDLRRLVSYWKDGFNWRAQEAELNQLPHYKTTINVDGFGELSIHFIHQRASSSGGDNDNGRGSIPLLFCHGCKSHYPPASSIGCV